MGFGFIVEVELLKLLSSYSNLNLTLSEQDKLISEISQNA